MIETMLFGACLFLLAALTVMWCRGRRVDGLGELPEGAAGWLSTDVLTEVANPRRLNSIRNTDRGRRQFKVVSERAETDGVGVFTICVDTRGVIALKDGHHRLLHAQAEGIEWVPVAIRQSRGIKSHGKHINEVLPLLMRQADSNPTGSRS